MERSTDETHEFAPDPSRNDSSYPPAARARAHAVELDPRAWLERTIETEIIPRLMLAHRHSGVAEAELREGSSDQIRAQDVDDFTRMVLRDDVAACESFIGALRERGIGLTDLYLDLVAPSARQLGMLWETDACDFAQVTLALWRLQNLVFDLSPQLPSAWDDRPASPRRALLAAAPGSQHTLGLLMVAEFFRRAGWEVWSDPCASSGDLAALLRSEWFDLIGFSVGVDAHVAPLKAMIRSLRGASRNPEVSVMVGGPILADRPGLVAEVDADFTAADAREAVARADACVEARSPAALSA